jgi:hypothetical protein
VSTSDRLAQAGFAALLGVTWWLGQADSGQPSAAGHRPAPFRLVEVAAQAGVDFRHEPFVVAPSLQHLDGQIAATGAGVAIVDVNGDGHPDLYATTSRGGQPNGLFLNQGDGQFSEIAELAGLADLNETGVSASMGSIWADVDGDGDRDAFIYGYGRSFLMMQEPGLRFTDATEAAGLLTPRRNTNAASWIDYDRDGLLDLYVAGYWRDDDDLWATTETKVMHNSFEFATDGGTNSLYRNLGDGRFEDVTAATATTSSRWTYAVAAADFNDDGFVDLYLANDYGPEELLLNRSGTHFEKELGLGLEEDSKSGMCVALGDVDNQDHLAVYVTNISESRFLFQGNNLRLNFLAEMGLLLDIAEGPVADCGWAWGAQFADLDSDGWQDLFVANGMISADTEKNYWYDMTKISGALSSVFVDAANWPALQGRSLSGYQSSRVLHNLGQGRFHEVGGAAGVSDSYDGRAVAVGDLFGDGTPDVVVANQRGPLLIYRSEPQPEHHWVELDLVGQAPNTDAIGASVTVVVGESRQRHVVLAGSGFSAQNDHRLHVGLGEQSRVDRVEIRWPSGREQLVEDLAADQVHRLVEHGP